MIMVTIKRAYEKYFGYLIDGKIPFKEEFISLSSGGHLNYLRIDKNIRKKYLGSREERKRLTRYELFEAFLKTLQDNYCQLPVHEKCDFFLIKPMKIGKNTNSASPCQVGGQVYYRTDENYLQILCITKADRCNSEVCIPTLIDKTGLIQSREKDFTDFPAYCEGCGDLLVSAMEPYTTPQGVTARLLEQRGFDLISFF